MQFVQFLCALSCTLALVATPLLSYVHIISTFDTRPSFIGKSSFSELTDCLFCTVQKTWLCSRRSGIRGVWNSHSLVGAIQIRVQIRSEWSNYKQVPIRKTFVYLHSGVSLSMSCTAWHQGISRTRILIASPSSKWLIQFLLNASLVIIFFDYIDAVNCKNRIVFKPCL